MEKQAEWIAGLWATTVESNKEWFTYAGLDFPCKLTDFHGNEVDSDTVVYDEIEIQTGLKPVDIRPAQRNSDNPLARTLLVSVLESIRKLWCLFGSRPARRIKKTDRPRQWDVCWDYHCPRVGHRLAVCQCCGETGHVLDDCTAQEQCPSYLGPHCANFVECLARPKKVHDVFRRLTKD